MPNKKIAKDKYALYIILIIILTVFLRVYKLDKIPNGFYDDGASQGYDAYSILKSGKDRYGNSFPLLFRSFDDYIPPFYNYSLIPFIWVFGLNEFAVRLPAALSGILSVILTYLIAKKLFNKKTALLSAFFLSVSPWGLVYSRYAFPSTLLLFFFLLGFYFILNYDNNKRYIIASAVPFALTFYSYATSKLFMPLFIIGFIMIYRKELIKYKKELIIALVLFILIISPSVYLTFYGPGNQRFDEISIFKSDRPVNVPVAAEEKIGYVLMSLKNYLKHFSFDFLFLSGDPNIRHSVSGIGQLYLFDFVLILVGLFLFALNRKKEHKLMAFWILIAPIAAALTTDVPHASRTLQFLPSFQIISSFALIHVFDLIKNFPSENFLYRLRQLRPVRAWFLRKKGIIKNILSALLYIFCFFIVLNISAFVYNYFISYPDYSAEAFSYGVKDAIEYAHSIKEGRNKIVVYKEWEIFVLFYGKVNPVEYQRNKLENTIFETCFTRECCKREYNNICIVKPDELNDFDLRVRNVIRYPDGRIAYKVLTP